jgi:hypothetical protein
MKVKVLVSLAGGFAEDDNNVVVLEQGSSVPCLRGVNVEVKNDELVFRQGFSYISPRLKASPINLFLGSSKASVEGGITAKGLSLELVCSSAEVSPSYLAASSINLELSSSEGFLSKGLIARSIDFSLSIGEASAYSQGSVSLYWKVMIGI